MIYLIIRARGAGDQFIYSYHLHHPELRVGMRLVNLVRDMMKENEK